MTTTAVFNAPGNGEFDVLAAFRSALADEHEPDPAVVAVHVAEAVPEWHLRGALVQTLRRLAPTVEGEERRRIQQAVGRPSSSRWTSAATSYHELLNRRIRLADQWKRFGECTSDDCRTAGKTRREHAYAVIAQAEKFERLADEMDAAGVDTVAELYVLRDAA